MKSQAFLSLVLLASASGAAMAACGVNQITDVGGTPTVAVVTFPAVNSGNSVTVGGLQATNPGPGNRPSNAVAIAYGSLANGATGVDLTFNFVGSLTGWSSSAPNVPPAAANDQVAFTSAANGNLALIVSGSPTAPTVNVTTVGTIGGQSLSSVLTGNTACVAGGPGWQNQEFHQAGGTLIDWKMGAGHPTDPTKAIGTWNLSGTGVNAVVNYLYGAQTFTYKVFFNGGNSYDFCVSPGFTTAVPVTMKTGQGACP